MSRLSKRAWYERVNDAWPAEIPPLTAEEAVRAARRLYRFAFRRTWRGKVRLAGGNRYGAVGHHVMVVNPARGWHNLIHILSHAADWDAGRSGHGATHARLERRMIREVVRRGWLAGKLKRPPKPEPVRDLRAERYARIVGRITAWERKLRRAENALKRLRRQQHYYERHLGSALHKPAVIGFSGRLRDSA